MRFFLRLGQTFERDEPGIVGAGMGDDAEAVGAKEDRATARKAVCRVDLRGQCGGGLPAFFRFAQTAGDQHH